MEQSTGPGTYISWKWKRKGIESYYDKLKEGADDDEEYGREGKPPTLARFGTWISTLQFFYSLLIGRLVLRIYGKNQTYNYQF